jgi:NAD(P)-dependent dehydrogenase (short-subunit alcohol dehydrogenase family)
MTERVAFVTGAGGAIGRSIALELGRHGHVVVINDIDELAVGRSAEVIAREGIRVIPVAGDVSRLDSVERMVSGVAGDCGGLDTLVNCAGVISVALVQDLTEEEWDRVLNVNLKSVFLCSKVALPWLLRSPAGRIVNVSSDAGKSGEPYLSHYSASKFGIIGFTQSLALELATTAVTVNSVCPSICDTEMADRLADEFARVTREGDRALWRSRFVKEVPAGRMAGPSDVACAVAYLVSDGAAFINGQALNVAGAHEFH